MSAPPKVPTETDNRLRTRVREVLSYFAAAAALCGVILGIMEYTQRKALNRAQNTMSQIEYWDSQGARDAYRALNRDVQTFFEPIRSQVETARENQRAAENLRRETVKAVLKRDGADRDLEDVVYFFSRLSLCVRAELCDHATARVFFEDTLITFLSIFEDYIRAEETRIPGYGEAVLCLRDRFADKSECT